MDPSEFDYVLPPELVAERPAPERTAARLLVLDRSTEHRIHARVSDLPRFLRAGDVLVVNNTRVFPARLFGRRVPTGGAVECLVLQQIASDRWDVLVHPGHKLRVGERILFEGKGIRIHAEILKRKFYGRREIKLWNDESLDLEAAVDAIGHIPLPPYIRRPDSLEDRDWYQTVYARVRGSIAAPTAGLHFTDSLLRQLEDCGIERVEITLHVGYGTFKPVRAERVEDHRVDAEDFDITDQAARSINTAREENRRIVAVGTTTTRALETAAGAGQGRIEPGAGKTDLFIFPGFSFQVIGGLLTNFHLPRSSLLMLVCAFAGRERVLAAYREAIEREYRFYSYGDAMLIV